MVNTSSIGSLGSGNSEAHVSGVTIDGAKLTGTTNGVRIKTWQVSYHSTTYILNFNTKALFISHKIIYI